jgi:hypothetical protein
MLFLAPALAGERGQNLFLSVDVLAQLFVRHAIEFARITAFNLLHIEPPCFAGSQHTFPAFHATGPARLQVARSRALGVKAQLSSP